MPCPICDIHLMKIGEDDRFTYGVAVAVAFKADAHAVTEEMCTIHRPRYMMSMIRVTACIEGAIPED